MTETLLSLGLLEKCWRYVVLGVIQGLTEFLPISSTAHLKVVPIILGWGDPGVSVTAVMQLGSMLAIIGYFKKDLQNLLKGFSYAIKNKHWDRKNARFSLVILAGTLPIIIAGMGIKTFWTNYEISFFRSVPFIALISITMAFLLAISELFGRRRKIIDDLDIKDGLVIGLGQVLALMPGVSRSGITLSTALLLGLKREDSARFSFLLGIPAITLAGISELKDSYSSSANVDILPLIFGVTSAGIVSLLSIHWLLNYLKTNNTTLFIAYRLFFGIVLLGWWHSYN